MGKDDISRAYLCDGYGCDEKCGDKKPEDWAKYECHHTLNESHAKNKVRRHRKWRACKDNKFVEVEDGKKDS